MEVLAHKIADGIAIQLSLDEERRSVIAYGLIGILQVTALMIMIVLIGFATDSLYESLIIFFSVGFMRKSTGGAHARTMGGCNTVSVLSIALLALSSRYLLGAPVNSHVNLVINALVFLIGYLIIHQRVPVDNPKKPIVSLEKIKRLRKESYYKLFLFFVLAVISILVAESHERFYSIASSIRIALLWQAMTLTEKGASFLSSLDLIVSRVLDKLKII